MKSAFIIPINHRFKVSAQRRVGDPNTNHVGEGMAESLK